MLRFQIKGIYLTLRFGFCMMLLFLLYWLGDQILVCLCCAALHECGHLLVCLLFSIPIRELEFRFTGLELRLQQSDTLLSPGRTIWLHGGGIFCNLICGLLFGMFGLREWAAVSLILAGFHAIPMRGMDGGRVFAAIGWKHPEVFEWMGQVFGFLIFAWLAAAALLHHRPGLALMAGLFVLCGILPQEKR